MNEFLKLGTVAVALSFGMVGAAFAEDANTNDPQSEQAAQSAANEDNEVTCRLVLPTGSHIAVEFCTTPIERIRQRENALEILSAFYGRPV